MLNALLESAVFCNVILNTAPVKWSRVAFYAVIWNRLQALATPGICTLCCFTANCIGKLSWNTQGYNSRKVISSLLPEAVSSLLITPVMSPCAILCHGVKSFNSAFFFFLLNRFLSLWLYATSAFFDKYNFFFALFFFFFLKVMKIE